MGSAVNVSSVAAPIRLTDPLDHVDYRLADTADEKDIIHRLRYRAYLHEGAIEPRADQLLIDARREIGRRLDMHIRGQDQPRGRDRPQQGE